ncbi:MAG: RecQ family ATP-dependent DNA helicase [Myxococcota bacterium]|nr:RecQ family ATP-dependent DNA helicase [Myxococcota bacterium]
MRVSRYSLPQSCPSPFSRTDLPFLFLDIELGHDGVFHALAARRKGEERLWERAKGADFKRAHKELLGWMRHGEILVGHNLHRFDRPAIAERWPDSPVLQMPTLDTLELSVLAFPRRPYHRLVKDDRLVRDARPNPVSDVRASERVLEDAVAAWEPSPLISHADIPEHAREGWRRLYEQNGWPWQPKDPLDLRKRWHGRVCTNSPRLSSPGIDMALVMLDAWLGVQDETGSVLPRWVRETWPQIRTLARDLRATACQDPSCAWCSTNLCPDHWLREVFGFESFREEPALGDGTSLQRDLVARGLRGQSTFGILPTGGGKSLCFQVPAEARYRLLGQLTVVVSPLQSLMKDQVDSLQGRIPHARAIYSGLPSLLRPQVLEEVRAGSCGLLYLSPEQLRNPGIVRLLKSREIGAVVFDEAHCLSQWGHDFRTDYPYVLHAIRRITQTGPMPPVFLFTATTQPDATREIVEHTREHSGHDVELVDGGSARVNLRYEVRQVPPPARVDAAVDLLQEHLGDGSAIVFCGTRNQTEEVAVQLTTRGYPAEHYHAGLDADVRRQRQDAFIRGEIRVITATNAFGMGVDKDDVRLVVHLDMPSSLEAYLQEAGRAGRDGHAATATLLWAPGDAEPRFSLAAMADLSGEDLRAIWRAIQQLPAARYEHLERRVVTPRELLFQEALAGRFDPEDAQEETRVKAAVNWLERARVLQRTENQTRVFTGRPRLPTLAQAFDVVESLDLAPPKAERWKTVLRRVYGAGDEGLSADDIAVLCMEMSYDDPLEGGVRILGILSQMVDRRLLTAGQTFTAILSHGVFDSSVRRLARWRAWEEQILDAVEEQADGTEWVHLRPIAERLTSIEAACTPDDVARLLRTWWTAGDGLTHQNGAPEFRSRRGETGRLTLEAKLAHVRKWLGTRQIIADQCLRALVDLAKGTGSQVLVSTDLEHLVSAVERDMLLKARLHSVPDAVRSAVGWLHALRIVTVQNGLAVFRTAMQVDRDPAWPKLGDQEAQQATAALAAHQEHKVLRVHVMDAWARHMLANSDVGEAFRADWFASPIQDFTRKWFPGRKQQIARPTTPESYDAIVTSLKDEAQQKIVTRDIRRNHLVLAGPGSGKTRILVHRVAWLLRCHRVRPREVLVVCYTRANALELRRRLFELVGRDARFVTIQTIHAVAISMVGIHRLGADGDLTLETCLPVAAAMLRGETMEAAEQTRQRDALLRGFNYLFVDEYQDIDAAKYELLSAIAGRAMEGDQRKLRVFAVGDDDQAIYAWDGASSDFIRSFEQDYQAKRFIVPHSYRSPKAILDMAQTLLEPLPDRLKQGTWLTVDPARAGDPNVGRWAAEHPELRGRYAWHRSGSVQVAAGRLMETVRRWVGVGIEPASIGVHARTRPTGLHRLRVAAEAARIPFAWTLPGDSSIPMSRIREVATLSDWLRPEGDRDERISAGAVREQIRQLADGPWRDSLHDWLEPFAGRSLTRAQWQYELIVWAQLERRARVLGKGVHLGTMHSAKGLEFDHVMLLDDGTVADTPEERRLLYVALTRARRSLQIFSPRDPSPVFAALHHPALEVREEPLMVADAGPPEDHEYGFVGPDAIWIDWLGRQREAHPGHRALQRAEYGDPFEIRPDSSIVDATGRKVALLSKAGRETWLPRVERQLKLKLIAVVRERADAPTRESQYADRLEVDEWPTAVWEARWRA